MKILKLFKIVLCLSIFLVSCSGDDGAIGPQGPEGEQGLQGDQGDQGEAGTANVIYSDWIGVSFVGVGALETNIQPLAIFSPNELNIDQDVVLVYGKRDGGSDFFEGIYALPYFFSNQNEYYGFVFEAGAVNSSLQVRVSSTDGGSNLFTFFNSFRYVIIPGGQAAGGRSASNKSQADYYAKLSYKEITALFNIPE